MIIDFFDVMLNLCVGIVGGIFSSIIVSRIFMINSIHLEQIARVQERFEKSYGLQGLVEFYSVVINQDDYPIEVRNALLADIRSKCKDEMNNFAGMILDDLDKNLYDLTEELNNIVFELSKMGKTDSKEMDEYEARVSSAQKKFDTYKKLSPKIFRRRLWTDKFLRVLAVIFLLIIVLTIIA